MKLLKNFKVGTKIVLGFLAILVLIAFAVIWSNVLISKIDQQVKDLTTTQSEMRQLAENAISQVLKVQISANQYLSSPDEEALAAYQTQVAAFNNVIADAQKAANKLNDETLINAINGITTDFSSYTGNFDQVVQYINDRNTIIEKEINYESSIIVFNLDDLQVSAYISNNMEMVNQLGVAASAFGRVRQNVTQYIMSEDPALLDKIVADQKTMNDDIAKLDTNATALQKDKLKKIKEAAAIYFAAFDKVKANLAAQEDMQTNKLDALGASIQTKAADISGLVGEKFNEIGDAVYGLTQFAFWALTISTVIAIVLGLFFALIITRSITKPLKEVTLVAQQITEVDLLRLVQEMKYLAAGDLTRKLEIDTQEIKVDSKDEIGQLAHSFNSVIVSLQDTGKAFAEMSSNLRSSLAEVTENASLLATSSSSLAEASEQSGRATSQIAATILQVARGSNSQNNSVLATSSAVDQLSRAIDGVARGAQEQAQAINSASLITSQINSGIQDIAQAVRKTNQDSAEASKIARDGAKTVEETIQGMQGIKQAVGTTAQRVKEMGERSEQIGQIVETISDIASQTNLLALNAAIEAARAGEHGKGFAVVADEVRKLAERSAIATKEISSLVKTIQSSMKAANQSMNDGLKEVDNGVTRANLSGEALEKVIKAFELVITQFSQMAKATDAINNLSTDLVGAMDSVSAVVEENTAATEEMSASSGEVGQSMDNIASISEENSASIEEVSASTEQLTAQVEETLASAQSLSGMAHNLHQIVERFRLNESDLKSLNDFQPEDSIAENSTPIEQFVPQQKEPAINETIDSTSVSELPIQPAEEA